jgi:hypothetical protein
MSQRLRNFLAQLEDISEEPCLQDIRTEVELLEFERDSGIILPLGYKEFCMVIGTAALGDFINLYSPNLSWSEEFVDLLKFNLQLQIENGEELDASFVTELLNTAFVFGQTGNAEYILFDLRTRGKSDQSYNIYFLPADGMEEVYLLGRDFFDFIKEFCFGTEAIDMLPSYRQPPTIPIPQVYSRFSLPTGWRRRYFFNETSGEISEDGGP